MMADSFDRTRPLVATRGGQLNGHNLGRLETVTVVDEPSDKRGEITEDVAARLHSRGHLAYADEIVATPVEDARTGVTKLVEVDDLGGGWFLLRAPWRAEGSKVQGAEAAEKERLALVEEGLVAIDTRRPPTEPGFTISESGSNGWFEVNGPGLAEPIKVRGEAAALAKRDELARGSAPPPPPPPPRPGTNTPEFKAGDVVNVGPDGEDLAGQRATIDSIEDGQAKVVGFVGDGDDRVAKTATVPLTSLTAADPEE
jgi:hypothetical protein